MSRLLLPQTPRRQHSLTSQRAQRQARKLLQRVPSTSARRSMPSCMRLRPRTTMRLQPHTPRRSWLSYSSRRSMLRLQRHITRVLPSMLNRLQRRLLRLPRRSKLLRRTTKLVSCASLLKTVLYLRSRFSSHAPLSVLCSCAG
jgi:hypothetical protein